MSERPEGLWVPFIDNEDAEEIRDYALALEADRDRLRERVGAVIAELDEWASEDNDDDGVALIGAAATANKLRAALNEQSEGG